MSHSFNNVNQAGNAYKLPAYQKVAKFEAGLQEEKTINYIITLKTRLSPSWQSNIY